MTDLFIGQSLIFTVTATDSHKESITKTVSMTFVKKEEPLPDPCQLPDFSLISESKSFTKQLPQSDFPYSVEIPQELESIIEFDSDNLILKTKADTEISGEWPMKVTMFCSLAQTLETSFVLQINYF